MAVSWRRFPLAALALLACLSSRAAHAQTPYLVKDINPGSENGAPYPLYDAGGTLLFAANDATVLPPQDLLDGYTGQSHAERGFRFLKAPQF